MEAVPRLPMLSLELKHSPEPVEFSTTLKQFIRDQYNEDPANYNKACLELEQLRQNAVQVTHDFIGCSTLKKYYAQLQFLQSRFPLQEGGEPPLIFTWEDVQSGREYSHSDVKFEQASILYNIGALHSILGAMDTRQSAEGMKVSCTHFQCAAWAFQYLRDHFGSSSMSPDMAHEILSFHIDLMLAQAQECILEKSMTDNRKSSITAKVAAQIVEFYRQAARNLENTNTEGLISSRRYKDWKRRIEIKILFYQTIMFFYLGSQAEEQEKHGERLAYFTAANEKLTQCGKLAKNDSSEIHDSLRFTLDVVAGKYNAAKKDNDFVYHEKVPPMDSLPDIKGASLVKGIPFNPNDPEVSGPDIFQKLVPMEAHESSSLYSEEKAKLLRLIGAEVEEKNEELTQFLASMQLDMNKLKSEPERLPQSLLEKCAAISVRPNAVKDLVDVMGTLSGIATEVELGIQELRQALNEEDKQSEEFQKTYGKKPDTVILPEIRKECDICQEQHTRGSQSNAELHKAMNTHTANLKLLSGPLDELQKALPSSETIKGPEDEAIVNELQRIMAKVEEMKAQRSSLYEQFRDEVHKDDITNAIVTHDGTDTQTFFQDQLKKHDKVVGFLHQNMAAQKNILMALTDANARFANIRKATTESSAQREAKIAELIHSYDVYEDLMAKSQKGLEFYKKLESNVMRLLQRCKGIIKANQEEREQIAKRAAPKGATPSRPEGPKPPQPLTPPPSTQSALPSFDGPKLKDYLPFMKPATFGPKKGSTPPPDMPTQMPAGYPTMLSGVADIAGVGNTSQMPSGMLPEARPSPSASPRLNQQTKDTGGKAAQVNPVAPDLPVGYSFVDDHPSASPFPQPQAPAPLQNRQPQTNPRVRPKYENTNTVSSVDTPIISPTKDTVNGHLIHTHNIRHPLGLRPQDAPDGHQGYLRNVEGNGAMPGQTFASYLPNGPRFPPPGNQGYPQQDIPRSTQNISPQTQGYLGGQPGAQPYPSSSNPAQPFAYPGTSGHQALPHSTAQDPRGSSAPQGMPGPQPATSFPGQGTSNINYPQQQQHLPASVQNLPNGVPQTAFVQGQMAYNLQGPFHQQAGSAAPQGFIPQQNLPASQFYGHQALPSASVPNLSGQSSAAYQPSSQASMQSRQAYQGSQPGQPRMTYPQGMQQYPASGNQVPGSQSQPQAYSAQASLSMASGAPMEAQYWQQQARTGNVASQAPNHMPGTSLSVMQAQALVQQGQQMGQQQVSRQLGVNVAGQQTVAQVNFQGQHQTLPQQGQHALTQQSSHHGITQHTQSVQQQGHLQGMTQAGQQLPFQPRQQVVQQERQFPVAQVGQQVQQLYLHQGNQPQLPVAKQQQSQPIGQQGQTPPLPISQSQFVSQQINQQQQMGQQGQLQPQSQGQYVHQQNKSQQTYQQQQQQQGFQNISQSSTTHIRYPSQQLQTLPPGQPASQTAGFVVHQMPSNQIQQQGFGLASATVNQYQQVHPGQPVAPGYGYSEPSPALSPSPAPSPAPSPQPMQPTTTRQGKMGQQGEMHVAQPAQMAQPAKLGQPIQGQTQMGQQSQIGQPAQGHVSQTGQIQMGSLGQLRMGQVQVNQGQVQLGQQNRGVTSPAGQPVFSPVVVQQQQFGVGQPGQKQAQQGIGQSHITYQSAGQPQPQNINLTQPNMTQPGQASGTPGGQFSMGQTPIGQTGQPPMSQSGHLPMGQSGHPPIGQSMAQSVQTFLTQPLQPLSSDQSILQPRSQPPADLSAAAASLSAPPSAAPTPPPQSAPAAVPAPHFPTGQSPAQTPGSPQNLPARAGSGVPPAPSASQTSQRGGSTVPTPSSHPTLSRQHSSSTTSSLDDILSSSPDALRDTAPQDSVLTPKILTAQELQQQKEEAMKLHDLQQQPKDPFTVKETLDKFVVEVERFEKVVENLCKPRLSGPSHLVAEWKELGEEQEKIARQHSMAVARCYVVKNRDPDIMPYDETRVLLKSGKDDYINASWMDDLAPSCPKFIASQGPLPVTLVDFWLMVYEQGTEVIVMLSKEDEPGKKTPVYWPTEKGQVIQHGPITLNLQSVKNKQLWMERIIYLTHTETKQGRTIVHLQYIGWPVSGLPEKIPYILQFINEVQYFYKQQRSLLKPVIVHCSNGVGRTGTFLTVYTGMQEINKGSGIIDLPTLITKMRSKRKNMITDMEHLKFCYEAILYHAQDVLMKRGILTNKKSFTDKLPSPGEKTHTRKPSEDFILGTGIALHALETNVAKFSSKHTTGHETTMPTVSGKISAAPGQTRVPSVIGGDTILTADSTMQNAPPSSHTLPDLVQQQPSTGQRSRQSEPQSNVDMLSGLGVQGQTGHLEGNRVRSGSEDRVPPNQASVTAVAPGTQSLGGSPQHRPRHLQEQFSSLPPSLADLQDPHTFTLDGPSGRRRITKASFTQKKSTIADQASDPNDPLSNLDPLWTIHKNSKGESVKTS